MARLLWHGVLRVLRSGRWAFAALLGVGLVGVVFQIEGLERIGDATLVFVTCFLIAFVVTILLFLQTFGSDFDAFRVAPPAFEESKVAWTRQYWRQILFWVFTLGIAALLTWRYLTRWQFQWY